MTLSPLPLARISSSSSRSATRCASHRTAKRNVKRNVKRGMKRLRFIALIAAVAFAAISMTSGCASRPVRHTILKRNTISVDLVRDVRGFTTEEKGYEHPAIVSVPRLIFILSAVEVEIHQGGGGVVRQPAFHKTTVVKTAKALSEALAQAGPDEAVGINVIRKDARLGVFNRKFLTNFLAHMDNGQLYLSIRRVDWPVAKTMKNSELPRPSRDRKAMNFRVVTGKPMYFAGPQDLEIDWQNEAFKQVFRLPGSTKGEKRRRDVLESSPIPKAEFQANASESGGGERLPLDRLSPTQLRALADLEEDRVEGRITETAYQRERRQLLRAR